MVRNVSGGYQFGPHDAERNAVVFLECGLSKVLQARLKRTAWIRFGRADSYTMDETSHLVHTRH